LPAEVVHHGFGAVVASLPPGEWTVPWIRDGAYAVAAMAASGMHARARDALSFYLNAEAGRFRDWQELAAYDMPAYQISLVRYYGFGVEETDFNAFGPNLEFDGFGLFLWALRRYEETSGDTSLREAYWPIIAERIADVIVALIEEDTGLMAADSSIWETHWQGRQRHWTYTNITAARGLCDAAALAENQGDETRAEAYRNAAEKLRVAIATHLTDGDGGLASNLEERQAGSGYWDAAVLDALAMGLFEPNGRIATATFAGLDAALRVPAGAGWARNDDRFDHAGAEDLSPWGSEYDSGEWVITDLRGAVAASRAGDSMRADRLRDWVRDQALANHLQVAEVFDEGKGTYKFNAPMVGFGAGAFILAVHARTATADAACGAYFVEPGTPDSTSTSTRGEPGGAASDPTSCACRWVQPATDLPWFALVALAALAGLRRRCG
jgi:GH15 family glucan-1,4-alpha-glucosidase